MREKYIRPLVEFMKDDAGDINIIKNYSISENVLIFKPTKSCEIHRLILHLTDIGKMDILKYGVSTALTEGLKIFISQKGTSYCLTPAPIKSISEWEKYCYDTEVKNYGTSTTESFAARWTFSKFAEPIYLDAKEDDYVFIPLKDNFTSLTSHNFCLQGHYFF